MKISIVIPCHNEEKAIRACVESCLEQTRKADQILVINDGSTDRSGEILAEFGDKIQVLSIPKATGNKSRAQERGLPLVSGDIFIATDGDTILHKNLVAEMEKNFLEDSSVVAVGGYVESLKYNWLTACRELDYIIGQDIYKVAQSYIGALFVIPGCAGGFRTDVFRQYMSFDHDTLTEDLDFTYKLHKNYFKIVYNRHAIAYTQDPAALKEYINQMRRWYCGGWQNLKKHWKIVGLKPNNSLQVTLTYAEGLLFSAVMFIFPFINFHLFTIMLIPYAVFIAGIGIYASISRHRIDLLYFSPLYLLLIYIHAAIFLEQFWKEVVMNQTNLIWFHPERREN